MVLWILLALAVPAGLARPWKACGLRPFPWKACGLRFAHRRWSGAFRPLPACPHPFHGAPGRTGPAGLPTGFPRPRPSAGDRFAFSTRPAAGLTDHQQHRGGGFGRAPPSLPPPLPTKCLLERTYRKFFTQLSGVRLATRFVTGWISRVWLDGPPGKPIANQPGLDCGAIQESIESMQLADEGAIDVRSRLGSGLVRSRLGTLQRVAISRMLLRFGYGKYAGGSRLQSVHQVTLFWGGAIV